MEEFHFSKWCFALNKMCCVSFIVMEALCRLLVLVDISQLLLAIGGSYALGVGLYLNFYLILLMLLCLLQKPVDYRFVYMLEVVFRLR